MEGFREASTARARTLAAMPPEVIRKTRLTQDDVETLVVRPLRRSKMRCVMLSPAHPYSKRPLAS